MYIADEILTHCVMQRMKLNKHIQKCSNGNFKTFGNVAVVFLKTFGNVAVVFLKTFGNVAVVFLKTFGNVAAVF